MDSVNSSGTFFRQKSTQKAPRPKVAFASAQSLSFRKTCFWFCGNLGAGSWLCCGKPGFRDGIWLRSHKPQPQAAAVFLSPRDCRAGPRQLSARGRREELCTYGSYPETKDVMEGYNTKTSGDSRRQKSVVPMLYHQIKIPCKTFICKGLRKLIVVPAGLEPATR